MQEESNTTLNLLSTLRGGIILDVATGRGGFIPFLLEYIRDIEEIIAIDNNARGEEAFQAFKDQPVHFQVMNASKMEFAAETFDTVCIANSLHHMADLPAVLVEMLRVLKPGGVFLVYEMYKDNQKDTQLTHVNLHHWWAAVDTGMGIPHNETYTRQEILKIVEGLNLDIVGITDVSDLSDDPRDAQTIEYLDKAIDQYLQRAHGLEDQEPLSARGEEIRKRVHEVGFHSATSLCVVGKKRTTEEVE